MFHLAKRFFGHLRATPLSDTEIAEVETCLSDGLAALFSTMSVQDQRHSYNVYERVGKEPSLATAALLHDIGKADVRLGAIARSVATVLAIARIPLAGSWKHYRDHGTRGADLLASAGADEMAVSFARYHPGPAPAGVDPSMWRVLCDADAI